MAVINNCLIVYDRATGQQLSLEEFGGDSVAAVRRYQELEKENLANPRMDIVLVGSDSLDTVRVTHASYFQEGVATMEQIEAYLKDLAEEYVPQIRRS